MSLRGASAIALLLFGGCGGAPPKKPAPVAVKPVEPPKVQAAAAPVCVMPPEETTSITHALAARGRVAFCIGATNDHCYSVEAESGSYTRLDGPPKPEETTSARVETVKPEVKVCTVDACTALTQKVFAGASRMKAATNETGTVAVFLLGDAAAGKGYAEIWDVPNTKKLTTFKYARGDFKCGDVKMLGETIYVSAATCNAPGARSALYTQKGKKLANVGGKDFGTFGDQLVQLDATTWAILEENGRQLAIQNVATGKIVRMVDLKVLWKDKGAAMGNPGESALVRAGDGKLAVVAGAPATGNVAVIGIDSGEIEIIAAPTCN